MIKLCQKDTLQSSLFAEGKIPFPAEPGHKVVCKWIVHGKAEQFFSIQTDVSNPVLKHMSHALSNYASNLSLCVVEQFHLC